MALGFDDRFAYAVGRIRVLENRMVDQARFNRMIDAESHDELVRILGETEFGGERDSRANAYERLIDAELLRVHELVASISPDPALTGVFRARHDFHNMKALLKAALAARDRHITASSEPGDEGDRFARAERALSSLGWLDVDAMKQAVEGMLAGRPGPEPIAQSPWLGEAEEARLAKAVVRAGELGIEAYEARERDPQQIDFVIDKESFRYFFDIASKPGREALLERVRVMVDLTNALTCLRLRAMGKDAAFAADALLAGGTVPEAVLLEAYALSDDEFWAVFRNTPYAAMVNDGVQSWKATGSPWAMETSITRTLADITAGWRRLDMGYEPVLGYLMAREAEADRLRRIFLGKMAKLPTKVIRERLSGAYA